MNRLKNTAFLILILCALIVVTWAALDLVAESQRQQDRRELIELSRACHSRWSKNGRYRPMPKEVHSWLELINQLDTVVNDVEWYAALIDLESLGDPTTNVKDGVGRSYGLGCIKVATARDLCARNGIKVTNLRYALLNPSFNIRIMVLHIENLYRKYEGDTRRILLAYSAGEPKADQWIAREKAEGLTVKYTHHRRHRGRAEMIRAVMFNQAGR